MAARRGDQTFAHKTPAFELFEWQMSQMAKGWQPIKVVQAVKIYD